MVARNSHCAWCGARFDAALPWPRRCAGCANTSYLNPTPVGVLIVPVDGGVLAVRRGIEPERGRLALPGGFLVVGETWQQGACRELFEETGIVVDPATVREYAVRSPPHGNVLLVFGTVPAMRGEELPAFAPNDETTECVVLRAFEPLAFPLHTEVLGMWFGAQLGS